MYRDSYALALMLDGKIQKESDDGMVLLPFGSEYALRLKNKLRKRAVADVFIDGRLTAKGIVIEANGTVDLERFVEDGNLSEGKKFKLVRINDPKVEQPNDSENGIIEVNFYPEKDAPVIEKTVIHEYKHDCWHHNHNHTYVWDCNICYPKNVPMWGQVTYTGGIQCITTSGSGSITLTNTNLTGGTVGQDISNNSGMPMNAAYSAESANLNVGADLTKSFTASNSIGEDAATVQGSNSLQKFSSVFIDVDRSNPVTLRLKVKGLSKVLDVCSCGYKRKKDVKFCPNDGTQLVA